MTKCQMWTFWGFFKARQLLYEAYMKELDAYPDQHKAELLRYMLNPVYHEPGKD